MKTTCLLFIFGCFFYLANAQQSSTLFSNNLSIYNPAFTAFKLNRMVYLESSTPYESKYDYQIGVAVRYNRIGIGVNHSHQIKKSLYFLSSVLNLSYALFENKNNYLVIGGSIGHKQDKEQNTNYPDNISITRRTPVSLGITYSYKKAVFGISSKAVKFNSIHNLNYTHSFMAGYCLQLNNQLVFKPNLLVQFEGLASFGLSLSTEIGKYFYFGINTISNHMYCFNAGIRWNNKFRLDTGLEMRNNFVGGFNYSGRISFTYSIK